MASLNIAIVGAGPVGCMLARILHVTNPTVSVTIFESDACHNFRSQGGTLDLHTKTGLAAIHAANLHEEFVKHARLDGDYLLACDKNVKTFFTFGPSSSSRSKALDRPEIDRSDLRMILANSLPEHTIKWGHRLAGVETDERGQKTLLFKNGSTATGFDLIVGAEGAWSKVRTLLTDIKPFYSGVSYHQLTIPDASTAAPDLHKLVNGGSVFATEPHQRLSVQQMGDGSLHVGYVKVRPETSQDPTSPDWCGYDIRDLESVRQNVLQDIDSWDYRLRMAVEGARDTVDSRNFYMLPVDFRWEHKTGITLVGDAAHLMTPFAGEGVNVGFDDARHLAAAICKSVETGSPLDDEVRDFEEAMFPRMNKFQRLTEACLRHWLLSDNVQKSIPKIIWEHGCMDIPWVFHPLLWLAVQGWWTAKSTKESVFG